MFEFIRAVVKFDWDGLPPKSCDHRCKLALSDVKKMLDAPKDGKTYDTTPRASNRLLSHLNGYVAGSEPRLRCAKASRVGVNGDRNAPVRTYRGRVGAPSRAAGGINKHRLREKSDMTYYEVEETTNLKPDFRWAMLPLEAEKTLNMSARKLPDILGKRVNETFMVPVCPLFLATLHMGAGR